MYNSYLHHKLQKKFKDRADGLEKSARTIEIQIRIREQLLKKYKLRTAQRVVDLAMDPVPIHNREITKSPKFFGDSIMRLKPRDSKARINDAVKQNIIFDPEPLLNNKNDFRPRHKEKEIQNDMKFTPKDRYQRLIDKWISDKDIIYSWEVSHDGSKSPIRDKMKKLYYKTIESVALNVSPESCSKDNSRVLLHQISEESFWDDAHYNDKEKIGILAMNALEKCNLRPTKEIKYHSSNKERF